MLLVRPETRPKKRWDEQVHDKNLAAKQPLVTELLLKTLFSRELTSDTPATAPAANW
jgi:hypothetical protein